MNSQYENIATALLLVFVIAVPSCQPNHARGNEQGNAVITDVEQDINDRSMSLHPLGEIHHQIEDVKHIDPSRLLGKGYPALNSNILRFVAIENAIFNRKRENHLPTAKDNRYDGVLLKISSGQASRYPLAFFVFDICLASQAKQTISTNSHPQVIGVNRHIMPTMATSYDGVTSQNKRALWRICGAVSVRAESEPRHPIPLTTYDGVAQPNKTPVKGIGWQVSSEPESKPHHPISINSNQNYLPTKPISRHNDPTTLQAVKPSRHSLAIFVPSICGYYPQNTTGTNTPKLWASHILSKQKFATSYDGLIEPNKRPSGNKLSRLVTVVETRHPLCGDDLLTKLQGGQYHA
ncbi:hypothetical protein [Psychrobacter sp. I-STPA6b]|uniref:hypothetical protein n=1 Tax=Psychrobacter sp. I-STPA6b TaxID=2585718 RepID=UPI001D0CD18F|nr:hypothetical protein [Psychrobacter sp. I-STPA6b]